MANRNQGQGTENRGFSSMDKEKQREISAKGGHASHGGQSSSNSRNQGGSARGGSSERHAKAGRQGHKNS